MIYWYLCPAEARACDALQPGFLSASERGTYAGLRFPKRRSEWLLGRWTAKQLLRQSLQAYQGLPLTAISVGSDSDGAPYLTVEGEGRLPASLSISHRAGRALCALSPANWPSIGVDIERVEPRAAVFVNDFFTAGEAARVWACPDRTRDTLVTAIWSAKEAVLKALRQGLRLDTRSVEIVYVSGLEGANTPLGPYRCLPPLAVGLASPQVAMKRVGEDSVDEQWHPLSVRCVVPGVLRVAAWWRPDGDSVLTAAAVWP